MRFRDQVALTLPALVLRLLLAVIFIWAGLAKVLVTVPVSPEQAAALASLNVTVGPPAVAPPAAPAQATPRLPEPDDDPDAEADPANPSELDPTPATDPNVPAETLPDPAALAPDRAYDLAPASWAGAQDAAAPTTTPPPADPPAQADAQPPEAAPPAAPAPRTTRGLITAADYPEGGTVRMVEMLALTIDNAANPPLDADSNRPDPIWPAALGTGNWPRVLAWAVAITELAAGVLVLIGLFTRLGALSLFGVMLGAMWLTEVGPAMQQSRTMLGFLPDHALHDFASWRPLWMQGSLACAALALFFLGAGAVSIDRAIFRSRRDTFDAGPRYTTATDPPPESRRPV